MWRPGFQHVSAHRARLAGYSRSFCIASTYYRGSEGRPGLVLGLDRGGACDGLAFQVPAAAREATVAYLRERELIYGVYRESFLPVTIEAISEPVLALTYVAERAHPSYAGRICFREQVAMIRAASGRSGPNVDYLVNTVRHLRELGLREPGIERLLQAIGGLFCDLPSVEGGASRSHTLVAASRHVPPRMPPLSRQQRRRFGHRIQIAR
ncbi:MAG: gamma-glutamylcyclotransferase [Hyphomicrobiaceae bacterium]|nr:gamma-glutamylcyclotransferase [Hyphomicrobiaceae bacterium]